VEQSTGSLGGDFLANLENFDHASKLSLLKTLLEEYDKSPPGTFPFPREVISEFILKTTNTPPADVMTPNESIIMQA
jgi:hypothetical protein